jgi:hypothetical protein
MRPEIERLDKTHTTHSSLFNSGESGHEQWRFRFSWLSLKMTSSAYDEIAPGRREGTIF